MISYLSFKAENPIISIHLSSTSLKKFYTQPLDQVNICASAVYRFQINTVLSVLKFIHSLSAHIQTWKM